MDEVAEDWDNCCPLCMEEMDSTDRQLNPCRCGYQVCLWCWNHIMEMAEKDSTEGRCPACRTPYDKERIVSATVSCDRLVDVNEKKQKPGKAKSKAVEGRKNLSNVRVIQRNLVYVVGIPANLADEETLERKEYFGQYGKILKISVSKSTGHSSQHSSGGTSVSVYVTYVKEEDALRCIQAVNGYALEGKVLKACFGTTKYCNAWLKHMPCNNPDCLYLHDEGTREDSFTKEEMIAKYGSKNQHFHDLTHPPQRRSGVVLPPPLDLHSAPLATNVQTIPGNSTKTPSTYGSFPKSSSLPAAASWGSRSTSSSSRPTVGRSGTGSTGAKVKIGTGTTVPLTSAPATISATCNGKQVVQSPFTNSYSGTNCMKLNATDGASTSSIPSISAPADAQTLTSRASQAELYSVGSDVKTHVYTEALDGTGKNENSGSRSSQAGSHSRHSSVGESPSLDAKRQVDDVPKSDQPAVRSCIISAEGNGSNLEDDLLSSSHSQDDHSLYSVDSLQGSSVFTLLESLPTVGDGLHDLRETSLGPSSQSPDTNVNSRPGSNKQASTSGAALETFLGSAARDQSTQTHPSRGQTWELQTSHIQGDTLQSFATAHADTKQSSSLSVGGLNIHLQSEGRSNTLCSSPADGPAKAYCSNNKFVDKSSIYNLDGQQRQVQQRLSSSENRSTLGDGNGHWAPLKNRSEGNEERELISGIFSEGFDFWTDGSPHDWAHILFNGKHVELSPSSGLKDIPPTSWKSSNSKQSRFQFARQDEAMEEMLSSGQKILSQSDTDKKNVSVEALNGTSYGGNSSYVTESITTDFGGMTLNRATSNGTSADPFVLPSMRAPISAPPGFSATRVSAVPPGFSSHNRPPDPRKNSDIEDFPRILATSDAYGHMEASNSTNDVEFFDPAIMAVGRGKPPSGVRQTAPFSATPSALPGLFSQASSLTQQSKSSGFDSNYQIQQRLLYGNFGGANPVSQLGFTNQEHDVPLPSLFQSSFNEIASPPRLAGQYRNSMGPHLSHLGVQEPVYSNGIAKSRLQHSVNAWDEWNRLASNSETNMAGQRLVNDTVGQMALSQMSLDRLLQTRLEELALSKELGSKFYGDAVPNDHDDQAFSNSRMGRFFLQN